MGRIVIFVFFLLTLSGTVSSNEVNIFSARHYDSDIQLYEKFAAKTGIKVNVVSGKDKALQKRIIEEVKIVKATCTSQPMLEDWVLFKRKACFKK